MERNDLVLYLDIPEFSEALYASNGTRILFYHKPGTIYTRKACCQKRYLPCWRRFPPVRSGKT